MKRFVVIDTQLLVLLVVGLTDERLLGRHKNVYRIFTRKDFYLLLELIGSHPKFLFLPHVLAETSNLIAQIDDATTHKIRERFKNMISHYAEEPLLSNSAVVRAEYLKLGLTDAVILEAAKVDAAILTADFDLYIAAEIAGIPVVNFNHEREARGTV